jgi:hypothetical protein
MHCCYQCFNGQSLEDKYALVRQESEEYRKRTAVQQYWNGTEPALQLLVLPDPSGDLPRYADTAEYLDPNHCRKCLEPTEDLRAHLRDRHPDTSYLQYRHEVLQDVVTSWPQAISPQILRSRLAAFKAEMTDANFVLDSCACCARQKRRCKLTQVTFPPVDSTVPPAWLPWNAEEWLMHRESWYKQVDECLNIRSYLRVFFKQEERLRTAQIEGHITGDSDGHRFDTTFSFFFVRRSRKFVVASRGAVGGESEQRSVQ